MTSRLAVTLLAGTLLLSAPAEAAVRYAAPGASGATPCNPTPCSLATAVGMAGSSDEVILMPGDYGTPMARLSSVSSAATNLNVHGQAGQPRPRVFLEGTYGLRFEGSGSDVTDVVLDVNAFVSNATGLFIAASGSAERVKVEINQGTACVAGAASAWRNSMCTGATATGFDSAGGGVSLVNVTAQSRSMLVPALQISGAGGMTAVNTIAEGPGNDVTTAAGATATFSYSTYATTGGSGSVTAPGSGTNITGTPLFVDGQNGDVHQAPGSPTIDRGTTGASTGTLDFDRDPRRLGATTDIGADEATTVPVAVTGDVTGIGQTTATLNGSVDPAGLATEWRIEYGLTSAFGQGTANQPIPAGSDPVPVGGPLSGLTPGTTYFARVVGVNAAGQHNGATTTFITASAVAPPPGPPPPPPPPPGSGGTGGTDLITGLRAPRSARIAALVRRRLRITFTLVGADSSYRVTLAGKVGGKSMTIGSAKASNQAAGPVSVRLSVPRKARAALARARRVSATLRVTVTRSRGISQTKTARLTLRR